MSPILTGIIASGISGHLTPSWSPEGAFDSLATVTLSTAAASVTFSGIPAGYKHLQIRSTHQLNVTDSDYGVQFNGDSGANYTKHQLFGSGSSSVGSVTLGVTAMPGGMSQSTSSNFTGAAVIDILDYSKVNKYKAIRVFSGSADNSGGGAILFRSGLWLNTSSINSITLVAQNGASLINANSQLALYGVK